MATSAYQLLIKDDTEIFISAISYAEIACAVERKRIKLDRNWKEWFRYYLNVNEWSIISIDVTIIEEAYSLAEPFHNDPADRIIVATSRIKSFP
ncbi:PIN domain-containing protein [candidate division KSB1 bacterium]|nr:PIN domain-containing protein [candidate division KSB1 bacterium]